MFQLLLNQLSIPLDNFNCFTGTLPKTKDNMNDDHSVNKSIYAVRLSPDPMFWKLINPMETRHWKANAKNAKADETI